MQFFEPHDDDDDAIDCTAVEDQTIHIDSVWKFSVGGLDFFPGRGETLFILLST